jgi:hypothetical protein
MPTQMPSEYNSKVEIAPGLREAVLVGQQHN